ncbi:MAG: hypothetical protein V5A57_03590 [Candidatus Paceibacterota bacterium]
MTNDKLRKKVLRHIDDMITEQGGGVLRIDTKKFAEKINEDPREVNITLEDLSDRGYIKSKPAADSGSSVRKLKRLKVTADGRDFLEGKGKSNEEKYNINVENINGNQVAVGENISQEQVITKNQIKSIISESDLLEEKEKGELKERIDKLEEELEKANPDKATLGKVLKEIKDTGIDQGFSLAVNYIIQQILASI